MRSPKFILIKQNQNSLQLSAKRKSLLKFWSRQSNTLICIYDIHDIKFKKQVSPPSPSSPPMLNREFYKLFLAPTVVQQFQKVEEELPHS